jgi:Fe-S-cluster containining protein
VGDNAQSGLKAVCKVLFFIKRCVIVQHILCKTILWCRNNGDVVKKKQQNKTNSLSRRVHFPEDEKRIPWLSRLLDAYAIADTGIAIALRDEDKKRKKKLACGKGCGNCCEHQKDLPLYPHELVGIYWYVAEKLAAPVRDALKGRLAAHTADAPCPFLIDGSCSIHPLRPIGCRQFNVFTTPCAPGEDPYYTRRDDVLVPLVDYTDRAFAAVVPFYNMKTEGDTSKDIRLIRSQIMNLQTFDWKKLVAIIEQAGSRTSETREKPA